MKQIIQVDDELKNNIIELEKESEELCRKIEHKFQCAFEQNHNYLVVELIRTINGNAALNTDILEVNYESYIEIGIESGEEYYPNTSIPIWKCKSEWFQKIGYLTRRTPEQLEKIITSIVKEMMEEKEEEQF